MNSFLKTTVRAEMPMILVLVILKTRGRWGTPATGMDTPAAAGGDFLGVFLPPAGPPKESTGPFPFLE
jgi:hypothetical protein